VEPGCIADEGISIPEPTRSPCENLSQHSKNMHDFPLCSSYFDFLDSKYLIAALLLFLLWSAMKQPGNIPRQNVLEEVNGGAQLKLEDSVESAVPIKSLELNLPLGYLRQVTHTIPTNSIVTVDQWEPAQRPDSTSLLETDDDITLDTDTETYETKYDGLGVGSDDPTHSQFIAESEEPAQENFEIDQLEQNKEFSMDSELSDVQLSKNYPWEAAVMSGPIKLSLNVEQVIPCSSIPVLISVIDFCIYICGHSA
jgi:hypothetical protein